MDMVYFVGLICYIIMVDGYCTENVMKIGCAL
jgi:hypothetical protein